MIEQINILIDMIKDRIVQNYEIIRENEEVINNLIIQSKIENRTELISRSYNINSKLKDENRELINIHLRLANYLNKYKEVIESQTKKASNVPSNSDTEINSSEGIEPISYGISVDDENFDEEQIFAQTIKGELIYESSHPRFNDESFYNRLFEHYRDSENYEMCQLLLLLKGK